jgi:predicted RNase H-like HicB family nuclease
MYQVIAIVRGETEDMVSVETFEEAVAEFSDWTESIVKDIRSDGGSLEEITIKIQKMEDVISITL